MKVKIELDVSMKVGVWGIKKQQKYNRWIIVVIKEIAIVIKNVKCIFLLLQYGVDGSSCCSQT